MVSCSAPLRESSRSATERDSTLALAPNAVVERVVDGDTIVVSSHGERERIRMIGVNTPESVHPTKEVECFGEEASAHTAQLLPKGTPVRLVRDTELRDRYGRLLAYVYRSRDALLVNEHLVARGFGEAYRFPPNTALAARFSEAQAAARRERAGMWAACSDTGG